MITIEGEVDHSATAELQAAVDAAMTGDTESVLLDLGECTYIDSGGISVILGTFRRVRENGWLGVVAPNSNVRRLFEIVGLTVDDKFRIFGDRAEAERSMGASAG